MALYWKMFALLLTAYCAASRSLDSEGKMGFRSVNDEDSRPNIAKYKADKEEERTLQRRSLGGSCQTGTVIRECYPDYELCESRRFPVTFQKLFHKVPSVIVSLAGLDVDRNFNLRVVGSAVNIKATGFDLQHTTWADTRIYYVKYSWVACTD